MLVADRVILAALLAVAAAHSGAHGQASTPPPPKNPNAPYDFDPSLAILVISLVSAFFFIGFFSIYLRECVESNNDGAGPATFQGHKRTGLDAAVVESFPVFVYSQVKEMRIGKGVLECAVCLSEFADDDKLRLIPKCSHVFHPDCIDMWLDCHVTCPVCRAKLSPESVHLKETPPDQYPNSGVPNSSIEQESEQTQVEIDVGLSIEGFDIQNRPPRLRISGKFPRSHSTGHSLVQPGECTERYTLRLPEDVRKQIDRDSRLKRTMSYQVVLTREGSWTKSNQCGGGDGGGEGSSRGRSFWVFSRTAPFVSRTGSVKCEKVGGSEGDGSNSGSGARRVLTAVRGPLACLSGRADPPEESSRPPPV